MGRATRGRIKVIVVAFLIALATALLWTLNIPDRKINEELLAVKDSPTRRQIQSKEKFQKYCKEGQGRDSTQNINEEWDYKLFKRPQFLKQFKNPCFYENVTLAGNRKTSRLHCVPYFMIAGFPKAGTTDLWGRLYNHPDFKLNHKKELNFYNYNRYKGAFNKVAQQYINLLDKSAMDLHRHVSPLDCAHEFPYFHGITGEATVDASFDNPNWASQPGNEHCSEPVVTNADYAYHINPNMKIIFMLRNPVERLYSDYIYEARFLHYPVRPTLFHRAVVKAIANHTSCWSHSSVRACAYNRSIETFKVRLRVGMYSTFIKDWMEVFTQQNVMVINSEDTLGPNKTDVYKKIFKFLDTRPFTNLEESVIFKKGPLNTRKKAEKEIGDMLPETRQLVTQFYQPFNTELNKMFPDINYNY